MIFRNVTTSTDYNIISLVILTEAKYLVLFTNNNEIKTIFDLQKTFVHRPCLVNNRLFCLTYNSY